MADDFPLAGMGDQAAQRAMTHYAPQPNPAQPYVQALQAFLSGGIQGVANQRGVETPAWSKSLGALLASPAANAALGAMTPLGKGVLRRPVETAFGGRATKTEPLPIGNESGILDAGEKNLAQGPTEQEWKKLEKIINRNSFEGDELHTEFNNIRDAVRNGTPFRNAVLQHGTPSMLEGIERALKKDRSELGLGWPEELPWQRSE